MERDGAIVVDVKNRFGTGDELELMTPAGNATFTLADLRDRNKTAIDVAPGSGHVVRVIIPDQITRSITEHDVDFGLLMRRVA